MKMLTNIIIALCVVQMAVAGYMLQWDLFSMSIVAAIGWFYVKRYEDIGRQITG